MGEIAPGVGRRESEAKQQYDKYDNPFYFYVAEEGHRQPAVGHQHGIGHGDCDNRGRRTDEHRRRIGEESVQRHKSHSAGHATAEI